jgi:putative ABC transport system substrate-binding protein
MQRRPFISALACGIVTTGTGAQTQPASKMPRIGYLTHATAEQSARLFGAFKEGLRAFGYVDKRNVLLTPRFGDGALESLPELAADLVRSQPDVIVSGSQPITFAAQRATTAIPIVMIGVADPVGIGLITSLARPGGNVTGLAMDSGPELFGKSVELLAELVPGLSRIGVLRHIVHGADINAAVTTAAKRSNVALEVVEVRDARDIEPGFARLTSLRVGAAVIIGSFFWVHRRRVAELALQHRLPAFQTLRDYPEVGLLVSYGANLEHMYGRAASYVDRILRGARPGELAVEQPTKFDLVINLGTAKALGLRVPPSLLARADEVIQ